jgi:hypothetical protein
LTICSPGWASGRWTRASTRLTPPSLPALRPSSGRLLARGLGVLTALAMVAGVLAACPGGAGGAGAAMGGVGGSAALDPAGRGAVNRRASLVLAVGLAFVAAVGGPSGAW